MIPFVSAFRGFFLPGVNLAEAGQAGKKCQQNCRLLALVDVGHKDISTKMCQDEFTEQQLRIVHLQEVGHILRPKNKAMNTGHRKVEFPDTLLICKMAILGWRKQLLKISMNFILIRILAMILPQHADKDEDVDVSAEEEKLQALTSVKWNGHQEEIVLKLSHHVTRQCNPWYHPRLKTKLYQPVNPEPKTYHPLRSYP